MTLTQTPKMISIITEDIESHGNSPNYLLLLQTLKFVSETTPYILIYYRTEFHLQMEPIRWIATPSRYKSPDRLERSECGDTCTANSRVSLSLIGNASSSSADRNHRCLVSRVTAVSDVGVNTHVSPDCLSWSKFQCNNVADRYVSIKSSFGAQTLDFVPHRRKLWTGRELDRKLTSTHIPDPISHKVQRRVRRVDEKR